MQICDFPGSRQIGKPKDWISDLDGDCLDIFVADGIDPLSGLPVQFTVFRPSPAELEALQNGGAIRLGIVGQRQHPVFQIGVLGPETCKRARIEPKGDLGGEVIGD